MKNILPWNQATKIKRKVVMLYQRQILHYFFYHFRVNNDWPVHLVHRGASEAGDIEYSFPGRSDDPHLHNLANIRLFDGR